MLHVFIGLSMWQHLYDWWINNCVIYLLRVLAGVTDVSVILGRAGFLILREVWWEREGDEIENFLIAKQHELSRALEKNLLGLGCLEILIAKFSFPGFKHSIEGLRSRKISLIHGAPLPIEGNPPVVHLRKLIRREWRVNVSTIVYPTPALYYVRFYFLLSRCPSGR